MQLKIKNVYKEHHMAETLVKATEGSSCLDLRSIETVTLGPGEESIIKTGIAVEIPKGHTGLLFVRSSIGNKRDLRLKNCVGVIDDDYRGEVLAFIKNESKEEQIIHENERFCQLLILPILNPSVVVVDELTETDRGEGGIGSTGKF